jgi:YD repeat-containing protein
LAWRLASLDKARAPLWRLSEIVQDDGLQPRLTQLFYDDPADQGLLSRIVDPLNREVSFAYDAAGRVILQELPGGREIGFGYDPNGNLTSLAPPDRPAHQFLYTPVDLEREYQPPSVSGVSDPRTLYAYDLDRNLDLVTRPDGQTVDLQYDAAGRLAFLVRPGGTTSFFYDDGTPQDPGTGQLASVTAPGGEGLDFGYHGFLLADTTWSGTVSGTVSRGHDGFLRVASETVTKGGYTHSVSRAYFSSIPVGYSRRPGRRTPGSVAPAFAARAGGT